MLIHNGVRLDVGSYNQSECCKEHSKYFSTCDTCEYGDQEEDNGVVDFYTGLIYREWYDFDGKWKRAGDVDKIVVIAANKDTAKEKLKRSVKRRNELITGSKDIQYALDEDSIKKVIGFYGCNNEIVEE